MKKIAFIWQGVTEMKPKKWRDGLWLAFQYLEKEYDVSYLEPWDEIPEDAIVLYWEAPCTHDCPKNGKNYQRVKNLPNKKALLFAGGRIEIEWLDGFDHVFYESKINGDELRELGVSCSLAFGINEQIMKPMNLEKKWDGIHHGTCASWKRQWLVGEALGELGCVVGRKQETDTNPFDTCEKLGTTVLPEQTPEEIAKLLNQSYSCCQTCDKWGGGQRCTLEALACNLPVVCMNDSPKNMEYVEESGCGFVVEPNKEAIKTATVLARSTDWGNMGRDYVLSKWTGKHYSDNLKKWLKNIQ